MNLPEDPTQVFALAVEVIQGHEEVARRYRESLSERDEMVAAVISRSMAKGDISITELAEKSGLERKYLYRIATKWRQRS